MKPWSERPFETKSLFNPAFCSLLLLRAIEGYQHEGKGGLPFSLAFLVLPLCLHKDSRVRLAANKKTYLLKLIAENPSLLIGFDKRCQYLRAYMFEGLGFAMQLNAFKVTEKGELALLDRGVRKKISGTIESIECQQVAKYLGKSFASIGDKATIYTSLGVRP